MRQAFRDFARDSRELDIRLAEFGGETNEATRLRLEAEAADIRDAARELGRLTPELQAQIQDGLNARLATAFEIEVQTSIRTSGLFDARFLDRTQATDNSLERRTVAAAEATATATKAAAATAKTTLRAIENLSGAPARFGP